MTLDDIRPFLEAEHHGVVTTFRRNGTAQMSIVASGIYRDQAVFVARGDTAKLGNLTRDPRCTVLTVKPDWSEYAFSEGRAQIYSWDNTPPEELRLLLREAYRACGGGEHPDWEEYDRVMKQERRAVVTVTSDRVYGFTRQR